MSQITESDFQGNPELVLEVLRAAIHGGFVSEEVLTPTKMEICEEVSWMESAERFKCPSCSTAKEFKWHTANPGDYMCLTSYIEVEPQDIKSGFRLTSDVDIEFTTIQEYNLFFRESQFATKTLEMEYKSLVFTPDTEGIEFADRAGSVVFLSIDNLPSFVDVDSACKIIEEIEDRRKNLIEWVDIKGGDDGFEKLTHELIHRESRFYDEEWGGRGSDQGKDGFCTVEKSSGEQFRLLIQSKYNNKGDSVNRNDVERRMISSMNRFDCGGLLVSAVQTTGDLHSAVEQNSFDHLLNYIEIWSGPDIKAMTAKHPSLIHQYFL